MALIQPMDQNELKLTKLYYRQHLLTTVISKNTENLSEALKELTLRDEILNLKLEWDPLKEEVIEECQHNTFSDETDGDNIALNVLRDPLQTEGVINEDLVSKNSNSVKLLNPNSFCIVDDTYSCVEVKEENVCSKIDDDEEEANDADPDPTVKKPTISDAQAVKALNEVLLWAEENGTDYSDVLVLQRLRSTAVKKNLNRKLVQTNFF